MLNRRGQAFVTNPSLADATISPVHTHAARLNRHRAALWMLCGLVLPTLAAAGGAAPLADYDLPAQPLAAALDGFAEVSGRSALFSSALVEGRVSSPVRGRSTPKAALQLLLEGTDLEVEEVSAGQVSALVLKSARPQALAADEVAHGSQENYDSLVQSRVWQALCADPRTARSDYRSLLRFRVDAAGRIERVQLLGTSGDARRDAAITGILREVRVGWPPPPGMRQPVAMLILPGEGSGSACGDGSGSAYGDGMP
jgi:hypothetical protein